MDTTETLFANSVLGVAFELACAQLREEEELQRSIAEAEATRIELQRAQFTEARKAALERELAQSGETLDANEAELVVQLAVQAELGQLDDLFAHFDSRTADVTTHTRNVLWRIFGESMQEALDAARRAAGTPVTHLIIKGASTDRREYRDGVGRWSSTVARADGHKKSNDNDYDDDDDDSSGDSSNSSDDDDDDDDSGDEQRRAKKKKVVATQFPMFRKKDDVWTIVLRKPQVLLAGDALQSDVMLSRSLLEEHQQQQLGGDSNIIDEDPVECETARNAMRMVTDAALTENRRRTRQARTIAQPTKSAESKREDRTQRLVCDYAVLHIKHLPPLKPNAAVRRKRKE